MGQWDDAPYSSKFKLIIMQGADQQILKSQFYEVVKLQFKCLGSFLENLLTAKSVLRITFSPNKLEIQSASNNKIIMNLTSQILPNTPTLNENKHSIHHSYMSVTSIDSLEKNPTIRPKVRQIRYLSGQNATLPFQKVNMQDIQSKNTSISPTLNSSLQLSQQENQQIASICDGSIKKFQQSFTNENSPSQEYLDAKKSRFMVNFSCLMKEIKLLKQLMQTQISEKVKEMHKIFSEGNKKSTQLVMMIVKQLEKQNCVLRQMLKKKGKQCNGSPITCLDKRKEDSYKSEQKQAFQDKSPMTQFLIIENVETQENVRHSLQNADLHELNKDQEQLSPIQKIQGHAQSILFINQHLQTIQEIENDDDEYSTKRDQTLSKFNANTFSSKSYNKKNQTSLFVSSFDQEIVSNQMNVQRNEGEVCSIVNKLLKLKQTSTQRSNKNKLQEKPVPIAFFHNHLATAGNIQRVLPVYEQKLQSLKFKQFPVTQNQMVSVKQNKQTNQGQFNDQIQQDGSELPFTKICLDSCAETEDAQSICEALSILKQYSLHDSEVLNQSTRSNQINVIKNQFNYAKNQFNYAKNQFNYGKNQFNLDKNQTLRLKPEIAFSELQRGFNPSIKQNMPDRRPQIRQNRIKKIIGRASKENPSNSLIYSKIKSFFPTHQLLYDPISIHTKRIY